MTINNSLNARNSLDLSGGSLTTSGGNPITLTTTAPTVVTFPSSGSILSNQNLVANSPVFTNSLTELVNSGIVGATNGGTGSAFTQFAGAATSIKTYTLPNVNSTILTTAVAVTVPQGGTGLTSGTSGGIPYFNSATTLSSTAALQAGGLVIGGGAGVSPTTNSALIYTQATGRLTMSSALTSPGLVITTTAVSVGHESAIFLGRGSTANGYAQTHFQSAGVEDWAIGTRLGSQNFTFWNNAANFAPYTFSKTANKAEIISATNVSGSTNEGCITLQRGDQANGASSVYFKTNSTTDWVLKTSNASNNISLINNSSTNVLNISQSGNISKPKSCSLKYYLSSTEFSITGDGTPYNLRFDKQIADYNGNYNGIFVTIPVTGMYAIGTFLFLNNVLGINDRMDLRCNINGTPSTDDILFLGNPNNFCEPNYIDFGTNFYTECFFNAGDEVFLELIVYTQSPNPANLVDFIQNSTFYLKFEG